jgi:hypothetical protein
MKLEEIKEGMEIQFVWVKGIVQGSSPLLRFSGISVLQ